MLRGILGKCNQYVKMGAVISWAGPFFFFILVLVVIVFGSLIPLCRVEKQKERATASQE